MRISGSGDDYDSSNLGARAGGCFVGVITVIMLAILSGYGWMPWWVPLIALILLIVALFVIASRDKT